LDLLVEIQTHLALRVINEADRERHVQLPTGEGSRVIQLSLRYTFSLCR